MSEEQDETRHIKECFSLLSIWALASCGFMLALGAIIGFDSSTVYICGFFFGLIVTLLHLFITISARLEFDHNKIREFLELREQVVGHVVGITSRKVGYIGFPGDDQYEYTATIKYKYRQLGASEPEEFTYIHKSTTKICYKTRNPRLLIRLDQPQIPMLRDELEQLLTVITDVFETIFLKCYLTLFVAGFITLMVANGPWIAGFCFSYILALFVLNYYLKRVGYNSLDNAFKSPRLFCEGLVAYFCHWIVLILLSTLFILLPPNVWLVFAVFGHSWISQKLLKRYGTSVMGNVVYRFDGDSKRMAVVFRILKASMSQSSSEQHEKRDEHDEVYRYYKVYLCEGSDKHAPCVEIDEWMYRRLIELGGLPNDGDDQVETELEKVAIVVPPVTSLRIAVLDTNAQQQTSFLSALLGIFFLCLLSLSAIIFVQICLFSPLYAAIFNAAFVGIAVVGVLTKCALDFGLISQPLARNKTTHGKVSHEAEMTTIRSTDEEAGATADISSTTTSE